MGTRNSVVLRLVAFAALATFAAIHWVAMLDDPPVGRVAIALAVSVAGAVAIATIATARIARLGAWALALVAALITVGAGALAVGLPARLLNPAHWGELADGLNRGLSGLGTPDLPYTGGGWSRLAILFGLALCLGLAATLAFWPARRRARALRAVALVILVAVYGTGVTMTPPAAPVIHGLALLMLIAAWLWLPILGSRAAVVGGALVLAAGAVALPVAATLDREHPWLGYRNWEWAWYQVGGGESFNWNHSYGPIDWPRTGRALLEVRSDAPHFWRTTVLDQFDGTRWLQSGDSISGSLEFPLSNSTPSFSPRTVRLNPDWIDEMDFKMRGLESEFVVGAGAVLSVDGVGGVTATDGGLVPAAEEPLGEGDTYTVRAYIPDPSPGQMRNAAKRYPHALAPYAALTIPWSRTLHRRGAGPPPRRSGSAAQLTTKEFSIPWWGSTEPAGRRAARALFHSPYRGVYRLAHRLTDHAPTTYAAVNAVQGYLKANFPYSETPPTHTYPLRAFLFKDRTGYCQQFSGAMALMLRMVGIPSRVATGFSPGKPSGDADNTYVVRDLDAHSWVEVYFNRIGWVPFDPTPSAAPAQSQTNGLGLFRNAPLGGKTVLRRDARGPTDHRDRSSRERDSRAGLSAWPVALFALLFIIGGGVAALWVRARRGLTRPHPAVTDARLRELEAAILRLRAWTVGGTTLLALERRLALDAGPAAAAYAARLRAARYSPRDPGPPTRAERRALRRDLSSGLGLRARLRGFLAIPPGGPSRGRGLS